jgi:hypothetical protein
VVRGKVGRATGGAVVARKIHMRAHATLVRNVPAKCLAPPRAPAPKNAHGSQRNAPPMALAPVGNGVPNAQGVDLFVYNAETMMWKDAAVMICGARGSGKTVFMKYIMYAMRNVLDMTVFMCPSKDVRTEFRAFLPSSCMHETFDKKLLHTMYTAQETVADQVDKEHLTRLGIILDDCMFDAAGFRTETMRAIIMNGRHNNVFFMNCAQHIMDFPKNLRSNLDVIAVFPPPNDSVLDNVYEHLLSGVFSCKDHCKTTFQSLEEHECLVFDAKRQRLKQPCLFRCKAPYHLPPFRVGSRAFWELHYKYMKRPERSAAAIATAVAVAKGQAVAPVAGGAGGGAGAGAGAGGPGGGGGAHHHHTGFVVRRMPALPCTVPLITGPGPAAHPPRKSGRKRSAAADSDAVPFLTAASIPPPPPM